MNNKTFFATTFILSALLASSAVLKFQLLLTDPFADLRSAWPIGFLWLSIAVEIAVIVFVSSGRFSSHSKWLIFIFLFTSFAAISTTRELLGIESCGCFGAISVPNRVSLIISLTCLAALWLVAFRGNLSIRDYVQNAFAEILSASRIPEVFGVAIVLFVCACLTISPIKQELKTLISSDVVFSKSAVSLEHLVIGQKTAGTATLWNESNDPIAVVGFKTSCTCVAADFQRTVIPSHGKANLPFEYSPKKTGETYQRIYYYLDSPKQHLVAVDIFGFSEGRK